MTSDISERVVRVLAETLEIPVACCAPHTRIKADLGADSMQMVTLMIALDEEFDVEFNVEAIPTAEVTVAWVIDFVTATIDAAQAKH